MEETTVIAGTFVELLGKLEDWKNDNDNYDVLSIQIFKMPNTYNYHANIAWEVCGEIK